jgi:hypothetical protein
MFSLNFVVLRVAGADDFFSLIFLWETPENPRDEDALYL